MMLFYKAWRESRSKFLLGVLALAGYCAMTIWLRPPGMQPSAYEEYTNLQVFSGTANLFFVLLVIFLGVGGILRERAHHTAVFTLALPVSRVQVIGSHVAVGLGELAVLALVPVWVILPLFAILGQSYPLEEALRYSLLRFVCGTFIFALSFFLSVVSKWEYTAPVACFMVLIFQTRIAWWSRLHSWGGLVLNPLGTIGGRWLDVSNNTIYDPLPWRGLSIMVLTAVALFAAASAITQRQSL
jgi:ABC-type transport system involved in multi-copper enzyme maturation permease subunit